MPIYLWSELFFLEKCHNLLITSILARAKLHVIIIIIQQIVTLSKYGHDALDICHP